MTTVQTLRGKAQAAGNLKTTPEQVVKTETIENKTVYIIESAKPEVVYVPEHRVYVVRDHDCDDDVFRYSGAWWVVRDGRWYRSRTWRGPFAYVHERYVPAAIWRVPAKHWRRHPHGGPPGLTKRDRVVLVSDRPGVVVVQEKHGKGRGKSERDERRR